MEQQVRAFLDEVRFAVLATIGVDGLPQQTVMWYILDGDEILMSTARGRVKDRHLQRDPRASICVEDGYRYVTLTGTVRLDDDPATIRADVERLIERYVEPERRAGMLAGFTQQERVSLRLSIEHVVANGLTQ